MMDEEARIRYVLVEPIEEAGEEALKQGRFVGPIEGTSAEGTK